MMNYPRLRYGSTLRGAPYLLAKLELHLPVVGTEQLLQCDGVAVVEASEHDATGACRYLLTDLRQAADTPTNKSPCIVKSSSRPQRGPKQSQAPDSSTDNNSQVVNSSTGKSHHTVRGDVEQTRTRPP